MASTLVKKLPLYCNCNRVFLKNHCFRKKNELKSLYSEQMCRNNNENYVNKEVKVEIGDEKCITLGSGKMAKLADGCAVVTYKDTTVMATVVSKESTKEEVSSFVPLTVSYKQRAAALGRIPLSFTRREGGQTEHEILTSRMIDRSVRPMFPKRFSWETQIICNPLAIDGNNFPDVIGINAASAALAISDVPWDGPVGAVRMGFIDGEPVVNPSKQELKKSQLNIVIAALNTKTLIMLDGSALNILPNCLFKCLKEGVAECNKIINGIKTLRDTVGKPKRIFNTPVFDQDLVSEVRSLCEDKIKSIFQDHSHHKLSRDEAIFLVLQEVLEKTDKNKAETVRNIFGDISKQVFKDLMFETDIRCDGRSFGDLRQINCETNLYAPLHGSALFQRGQTQVFCTVALDSPNSALKLDKISMLSSGVKEKNFFVHYEFPPFATKDTGRLGPIGRREVGHGALAEKALQANIPHDFPFTIRLTSEVLESNGSSSMATVCGGTLALMDAGVPIENPCAGVAMGFVSKCDDENNITDFRILTDILGIEDYLGEMDFKIAGTKNAFTAFQLDVKNNGIPYKVATLILQQAKDSISNILNIMRDACPEVRKEKKKNFPEIQTIKIPVHLRSKFIGPGGANIKKLEATIGVEVLEETVGQIIVFAPNKDAMLEATEKIEELLSQSSSEVTLEFGAVYSVFITEIKETGCMVSLHPDMKPIYIPLSQLDMRKVSHPIALGLQVGDEIKVKYFGREPVSGAIRLSRKVLMGPVSEVAQSFKRLKKNDESVAGASERIM